jgi:nucleotide-binding universal stress UspA family protein
MPVLQRVSVSVKNILLATDFSPISEKAACYAKALALNFRSEVEIAHIFEPSRVLSSLEAVLGKPAEPRLPYCVEGLERLRKDFAAGGVGTGISLLEGHTPHVALLKAAEQHATDLIVAGTHSRSGLERLVLGSVAEQMIRKASCPVLTVGPHAKHPGDGPLIFRTIVCATDFSPKAAKAAVFALSFAQDSGAHLYFCYVAGAQASTEETQSLDSGFKAALKRMIPESTYEWCTPETVVEHGEASKAILDLASRVGADLIVLGSRKSSFWLTHVEHGLTPDLLAEATCPVMTVC